MSMQVYKAKMGVLDVAVKTINRQHINPELNIAHALRVMQKVCRKTFAAVVKQLSVHQLEQVATISVHICAYAMRFSDCIYSSFLLFLTG